MIKLWTLLLEEEELDMEEGKVDMQEENEDEIQNNNYEYAKPISTTELLVLRNQKLQQRKLDIGILSSGFLENAEEKVSNLKILLDMIDEEIPEIHYTVKKLVIMSLLEIFKDVLPSYEIKVIRQEGVKRKYLNQTKSSLRSEGLSTVFLFLIQKSTFKLKC